MKMPFVCAAILTAVSVASFVGAREPSELDSIRPTGDQEQESRVSTGIDIAVGEMPVGSLAERVGKYNSNAIDTVPSITSQPTAQATILGGPAVFTVMASGTPPLSYQWRKYGVNLQDGGNIAGASDDTLILSNCALTDAGDFSVVVGDALGSTTSVAAELVVNLPRGGDVDFSFSPGACINASISSMAVQVDGKIMIAGSFSSVQGAARGGIARLNSDGTTDHTFMNGMTGANDVISALALQADGKVVIVGNFTSINGVSRNRIARLNTDGSLDTTFQNGMSGAGSNVIAVAVQEDGRVIIGGPGYDSVGMTVNGVRRDGIARLNADGSLDTTFPNGMGGINGNVNAIVMQADGKVLIVGNFSTINGVHRGYLARLNADGNVDTTFQNGMNGANSTVLAVAVQADGRVLVGGDFTTINGISRIHVARLNADGSVDTTFQNAMSGANQDVVFVAVQGDGKVLIGGVFEIVNGVSRNRIARLNADGGLDTTFQNGMSGVGGTGGFSGISVRSLVVQATGQVLIAGNFTGVNGVSRNRIARLEPDGSLETTSFQNATGVNGVIQSVAAQSDGKVLIGGDFTKIDNSDRGRIARLNADGSLDTTFQNGMSGTNSLVESIAVQSDGKVLIGGEFFTVNGVSRNRIARLNADGSLDTSFQNGMNGADEPVAAVAVQSDGKVLIGGRFTSVNGVSRNHIARLNTDGSLDAIFQNGVSGANDFVPSLAVQTDGRVVIGGWFSSVNGVLRRTLARLNTDGSLDTLFVSETDQAVNALAIQINGSILIGGGFGFVNGVSRNRIAQLNADGSLDTTFQNGMNGPNAAPLAVAAQTDGKALIGGDFTTVGNVSRNFIARLNADGSLDATFQSGMSGANFRVYSVAVQTDGKVLIAGAFGVVNGVPSNFVARIYHTFPLEDCVPAGTSCDDGNACTTNDSCGTNNTCVGGPLLACYDGDVCTDDSCNAASGCVFAPAGCFDGNPCTDDGTCLAGVGCTHVPNTAPCDDGNECTVDGTCVAGTCVGVSACEDGDACTVNACIDGGCVDPEPLNCDDGDPCTRDSCNPASGCIHVARNCDDANACTDDTCNPSSGCLHANNTNPCDDGNPCTTETCIDGQCEFLDPVNCDDGNPCTDDSCDPTSGCVHTPNDNRLADWTVDGGQEGAHLQEVASAGDVNGDGFGDVIIGARGYSNGEVGEGRAWVYHGSATGLSPTPAWTAESNQTGAALGSVAGAGDVNGDGYDDVVVGAPRYTNGRGAAFVYLGSAVGLSIAPAWTTEGNDQYGIAVSTAGDVNGDGFSDVIVAQVGRAYAYLGSAAGLSPLHSWSQTGPPGFGVAISTAGDVNGDTFDDVIIGSDRDESAYVYMGSASGLATTAASVLIGNMSGTPGASVRTANGDINGDGFSDVVIKGTVGAFVYMGSAAGLSTTPAFTLTIPPPNDIGAVSTAGDVNNDGFADVIVGDLYFFNSGEGQAFVYLGSPSGPSSVPTWSARGGQYDSRFGVFVSTAGDVNGNGYDDVIVGAETYSAPEHQEGRAFVFYGSASGIGHSCVSCANEPPSSCDDTNACTEDSCDAGSEQCVHVARNCDDANACTDDTCNPVSGCLHANNTNPCDDGDPCTQTDSCMGGTCTGANPVICSASDQCHVAGTCDPASGECSNPPAANGTSCDDGNACTTSDVCANGACVPALEQTTIGAGYYHTCALRSDGRLACWGNNDHGQVAGPNGSTSTYGAVSGGWHDTCTLRDDGRLACWGYDQYGQVSGPNGSTSTYTAVSVGFYHTCALRTDGLILCWGSNSYGQVSGPNGSTSTYTAVSAGTYHTCGLRGDGRLGCWGYDNYGQVSGANGSTDGYTAVSVDTYHTCALRTDRRLVCWGGDDYGQVSGANGSTDSYVAVSLGWLSTCALRADGRLACWGNDDYGQVSSPNASASTYTAVVAGHFQSCALGADGRLACWGGEGYGEVSGPNDSTSFFGLSQLDCDDGNPCTQDSCDPIQGCLHTPGNAGAVCRPAAGSCDVAESCDGTSGDCPTDLFLPAATACRVAVGACDVAESCTGTGAACPPNTFEPDGTGCNDGSLCTQIDTCQAGACVGSSALVCPAPDQCHLVGVCDPATGVCSNPAKPNGATCNDGNACTQTDTCQAGVCTGSNPVVCTALDQCHTPGVCDPQSGTCSNPLKPNGSACNDGNACTSPDSCSGGTCTGGPPVSCNDANLCTTDSCNPSTGCLHVRVSCGDNDACTIDSCVVAQGCRHSPLDCFDDDSCTIDTCDTTGGCQHAPNNCTKSVEEQVPAGGSATTDTTGGGATPLDPVQSTVTTPNPGPVTINVIPTTTPPPTGFGLLDLQIQITAPQATPTAPIRLTFLIDASTLPPWFDLGALVVYRNGAPIADCSLPNGEASPDPCVASRSFLTGGDVQVVVLTSLTSLFNALTPSTDTFNFGIPDCSPPPEVGGVRILTDKQTLAWDLGPDPTATYQVTRGRLSELPVGNGISEACVALDLTIGIVADEGEPEVDGSFWYLVRARNACGAGSYGAASDGSPRDCRECP